jgi:VanZ family protein
MKGGRYGGSAAVWACLLAYASLYPFLPLRLPSPDKLRGVFAFSGMVIRSDVVFNVVAYVPFGMLLCLYFRSQGESRNAIARAALVAAGFSAAMEVLQLFIPGRVTSIVDLATNVTGALLGSLVFADPLYAMATRPLGEARERIVVPGAYGDAGLVMVMLWLLAQLNPALPFFGAGDVARGIEPDLVALQWAAVAMGICGFALFLSALLESGVGSLRATLALLSLALWLKFAMASFILQPHASADWARGGRIEGVVVGLLAFMPLRRMGRLTRIYLAFVLILAGALFAKLFGAYSAMDEFLRLFRWPHGQLASFATLTRFIHELWPFAAVVFLVALFFHARRIR